MLSLEERRIIELSTRIFDGRPYVFDDIAMSKATAQDEARHLRKEGRRAKIVKRKHYWIVYKQASRLETRPYPQR